MPTSKLTRKGQTTVPKEVRDALALEPGDKLLWEVHGGRVTVTTERPSLFDFEGFIKNSSGDVRRRDRRSAQTSRSSLTRSRRR